MSASEARSISVTMSVPVLLVPTSSRTRPRPSRSSCPGRSGHPLGEGAQLLGVGVCHRSDTRFRPCPIPLAAWTCAATRSPDRRPRCAGRWPTPRSATTGSGTIRRSPGWRRAFAERVGKEASLFVPSGTMANQIALRAARPRPARWCSWAAASTWSCARPARPVATPPRSWWRSTTPMARSTRARWPAGSPMPASGGPSRRPCSSRTPTARWGVGCGPLERLEAVAAAGLPMHLDGARLWNAAVASGTTVAERAASATTVTCCVSKGLGAPVGSLLAGPADLVARARWSGSASEVGCARWASSRRPACSPSTASTGSPTTTSGPAGWRRRRRRGGRAAWTWRLVHTNIVRITVGDPAAGARAPRASTVCSRSRAAPTRCGSSPTPTSTTPTSTGRRRRRCHRVRAVIEATTPERALAVYAHPDDPEVACGGTLARWAALGCRGAPGDRLPWREGQLRPDHRSRRARRQPRRRGGSGGRGAAARQRRAPRVPRR